MSKSIDEYFTTPEDLRLGYGMLKDNNFVPEEVQMLKEIEELKSKLSETQTEPERKQLLKEIEARRLKYNLLVERFHRQH